MVMVRMSRCCWSIISMVDKISFWFSITYLPTYKFSLKGAPETGKGG